MKNKLPEMGQFSLKMNIKWIFLSLRVLKL
jgi:hypothetical protein